MIAIEYTDMISRMITTVIATAPMFLTISVIVNSVPVDPPAAGLGEACKRNRRKPIAFVPRMVVRIVTVTPPKVFDYVDSCPALRLERWLIVTEQPAPKVLLRYKVVDDYAVDLDRLAGKFRRRKLRRHRGRLRGRTQQRMSGSWGC